MHAKIFFFFLTTVVEDIILREGFVLLWCKEHKELK